MRPVSQWEKYIFLGPEHTLVAVDQETGRTAVLEGELKDKRFKTLDRAAAAILSTYEGILTSISAQTGLDFPGEMWISCEDSQTSGTEEIKTVKSK